MRCVLQKWVFYDLLVGIPKEDCWAGPCQFVFFWYNTISAILKQGLVGPWLAILLLVWQQRSLKTCFFFATCEGQMSLGWILTACPTIPVPAPASKILTSPLFSLKISDIRLVTRAALCPSSLISLWIYSVQYGKIQWLAASSSSVRGGTSRSVQWIG